MRQVVLFYRKPVPHFFSVEKVFNQVSDILTKHIDVQKIYLPHYTSSLLNAFRNLTFVRKHKAAVYHVTGDAHYITLALPKSKTILTIHDCVFLNNSKGLKRWFFQHFFLKWPVNNCQVVTTISEFSKNDIIKYSGCEPGKVVVINNPVPLEIEYRPKEMNVDKPVFLFLGSTPNKNLSRVIEAVKHMNCVLDIVGVIPPEELQQLKQSQIDFRNSSKLSDDELRQKYYDCDVLLFPSLYEGFGLPIIEAQKAGRPVITSNISPLKDVAGRGACLVNPTDNSSILHGIIKVVHNREYRQSLITSGFRNVQRFHPETIAMQYHDLYKQVATQSCVVSLA